MWPPRKCNILYILLKLGVSMFFNEFWFFVQPTTSHALGFGSILLGGRWLKPRKTNGDIVLYANFFHNNPYFCQVGNKITKKKQWDWVGFDLTGIWLGREKKMNLNSVANPCQDDQAVADWGTHTMGKQLPGGVDFGGELIDWCLGDHILDLVSFIFQGVFPNAVFKTLHLQEKRKTSQWEMKLKNTNKSP